MARILTEESSLTRKRQQLLSETETLRNLLRWEAGMAIALLVAGAVLYFYNGTSMLFGLGIAAAVFFLAHYLRIQQNSREERIVQAGLKGEVEVTRKLAQSLDNSHYVFNDLLIKVGRKSAQLDHLIVSPRGIFTIETKNWRGHLEGDESDDRWQQTKEAGQPPILISNPIRQTQRHLDVLRAAFERAEMDWPDIVRMVVFLSPKTTFTIHNRTVPVLRPDEAIAYIRSYASPRTYTEQEIDAVVKLFMEMA